MTSPDGPTLRMADANLNRCLEGLRVLEDVARFILDHAETSSKIRVMRHTLATQAGVSITNYLTLLDARSVEEDVGYSPEHDLAGRSDLVEIVIANAKRAQESLRVLEELGRLPAVQGWTPGLFQEARYTCYQIEQQIISLLGRKERLKKLPGLYAIIDPELLGPGPTTIVEAARRAVLGGAAVVQLRDKKRDKGIMLRDAQEIQRTCAELGAIFIVNDHADIAAACSADGVHLGQKDMPIAAARKVLPFNALVGKSTATKEEALEAVAEGADYVAVGAMFPTESKSDTRPAGLETLRQVRQAVSLPLVAIGGINADNLTQVVEAGADGVAIISALLKAPDIQDAARLLSVKFKESYDRSGR